MIVNQPENQRRARDIGRLAYAAQESNATSFDLLISPNKIEVKGNNGKVIGSYEVLQGKPTEFPIYHMVNEIYDIAVEALGKKPNNFRPSTTSTLLLKMGLFPRKITFK